MWMPKWEANVSCMREQKSTTGLNCGAHSYQI